MVRKKVLIVASLYSHISQFHQNLINMLVDNDFIVDIAGKDNLNEKPGRIITGVRHAFHIRVKRNPFNFKNVYAFYDLKKIIHDNNYDYIHANTPIGGVLVRMINYNKLKNKPKIIYTAHGFHFYNGAPLKNWILYYPIEKILSKKTSTLITINKEDYLTSINKRFSCEKSHIHGVGVNDDKFKVISLNEIKNRRMSLHLDSASPICLCIGELNKNKNQKVLIEAISEVKKKYSGVMLLIAGNGPNKSDLETMVINLKLEDNIHFLGYTSEVEKYVQISDMIISASIREGLGLNIIEGMLCKKVIIASENRGHKELINDNENGFLVKNNKQSFAKAIENVITLSNSERERITQRAYVTGLKYSWKNVKKEMAQIYDIKVNTNERTS